MKHTLKISVSKEPQSGGIVQCRNVTLREKLLRTLPSGRRLAYVKPKIGENRFGGEAVTYEGVGSTKKWERLESYGPKFVENCIATGTLVISQRGLVPIARKNFREDNAVSTKAAARKIINKPKIL